jgi:hypothetical protein
MEKTQSIGEFESLGPKSQEMIACADVTNVEHLGVLEAVVHSGSGRVVAVVLPAQCR